MWLYGLKKCTNQRDSKEIFLGIRYIPIHLVIGVITSINKEVQHFEYNVKLNESVVVELSKEPDHWYSTLSLSWDILFHTNFNKLNYCIKNLLREWRVELIEECYKSTNSIQLTKSALFNDF